MNNSSTNQDYDLWVLLGQTRQAMVRARQKELDQYGISVSRAAALFAIHTLGDKAAPGKISRWLFRESHSVSELLSKMEREGLVRKVKDTKHQRQVRVMITDKGLEAYGHSLERASIQNIMSSLSRREYQQLKQCLLKLRRSAMAEIALRNEPPFP